MHAKFHCIWKLLSDVAARNILVSRNSHTYPTLILSHFLLSSQLSKKARSQVGDFGREEWSINLEG